MKKYIKCSVAECNNSMKCKNLCNMHYCRFIRHGSTDMPIKIKEVEKKCSVPDCNNFVKANKLCCKHYQRMRHHGTLNLATPKTKKQLLVAEGKSFCPACNMIKTLDHFHKDNYATLRIAVYCKECCSKKGKLSYCKSKNKRRNYEYHKIYNISLEDYNKMLKEQDNKCLICHKQFASHRRSIHIDHNHKTGKVRGLLCPRCNPLLGLCNDDISILKEAINYLKKNASS